MDVMVTNERWRFVTPFRIAYEEAADIEVIVVTLTDGIHRGRGEAAGVSYHGETVQSMIAQIEAVRGSLEVGIDRQALQLLLPAGGARNAIDCALWDLEAKRAHQSVSVLAGLPAPRKLSTFCTIGLDVPDVMATQAANLVAAGYTHIKLKLCGKGDLDRVRAVRASAPTARLIVDANQSWSTHEMETYPMELHRLGVELIEQPMPMNDDAAITQFERPIPICADESCQTTESLNRLVGLYDFVNVKLDKTGGLTEALRLSNEARSLGFNLMVGNMCGTSLAMAPAFLVGQNCLTVDLDGPLLNVEDRPHGLTYRGALVDPPSRELWG